MQLTCDRDPENGQIVRIYMRPGERLVGTHARFENGFYILPPDGKVQFEIKACRVRGWAATQGVPAWQRKQRSAKR